MPLIKNRLIDRNSNPYFFSRTTKGKVVGEDQKINDHTNWPNQNEGLYVYAKINNYYYSLSKDTNKKWVPKHEFDRIVANPTPLNIKNSLKVEVPSNMKNIIVHEERNFSAICGGLDEDVELHRQKAELIYKEFQEKRVELLEDGILNSNDFSRALEALRVYTFSDEYTFWVYNPRTQTFTKEYSSCNIIKNHINLKIDRFRSKQVNPLIKFFESNKEAQTRKLNKKCLNYRAFKNMNTQNRIRIKLRNNMVGILTFYSKYENFNIDKWWMKYLNVLKLRYNEVVSVREEKARQISEVFINNYTVGHIDIFLYSLVNAMVKYLHFEACSIFLLNSKHDCLELKAIKDLSHDGIPSEYVSYPLNEDSMTSFAFKEKEGLMFSYDINNDPRNSHRLDDETKSSPTNWVAVRIGTHPGLGVIRLKNKVDNVGKLQNFLASDIETIENFAMRLANVIRIDRNYKEVEEQENIWKKKFENLNKFSRIYGHEIRTPLSTFLTFPELIIQKLRRYKSEILPENDLIDFEKKLNDIRIMGERLEFITDVYRFDKLVEVGRFERLPVEAKLLKPVINFVQSYLKATRNMSFYQDIQDIRGRLVYGNQKLLTMVLNILLDNAAKYSTNRDKYFIELNGKYNHSKEQVELSVNNYGLEIHPEEKDRIFDENYRGIEAIRQQADGSGIGLYLARVIMVNHRGSIELTSLSDPITFKMTIPSVVRRRRYG